MKVSDRAIAMFGAWSPARHAISSAIPRTRMHVAMLADTESRSRNDSAGAGQESASRATAAMIPAELATSTSIRTNANRGADMSCPGWKCGALSAVSHLSVTSGNGFVTYLIGRSEEHT